MVEWNEVDWRKLEYRVFKLQKRIYQASGRGDVKAVRRLQKTLLRARSTKMLAVRRVTQDNQGKKTAGVDGIKSLKPKQRLTLVQQLRLDGKAKPTRRVRIPKPGTEEKRPLGIPTMYDRALQALAKLALEPEWEARFEPNSYGFRPGRSCHDAIEAIFNGVKKEKYVLDADISKCFDRINHKALLDKLNTSPTIRRQIKAWLKAGVMEEGVFEPTTQGTPQGGVISPLLANIALHGMETRIRQAFPRKRVYKKGKYIGGSSEAILIRYADDFVIIHEDITVVQKCQQIITEWLSDIGLELKPSKTRLTHTLNKYGDEKPGFDFLGFTVRQFPTGKYQSAKSTNGKPRGFKTIIKPSEKKIQHHSEQLAKTIEAHKSAKQKSLIGRLNPIIKGWTNYYSTVVSKEIFSRMSHELYQKLRRWCNRRHPNKNQEWIHQKYWQTVKGDNWVFAAREKGQITMHLIKHPETKIVRHIKVQGERSPYDGDWIYWGTRMGRSPEIKKRVARLLKEQKGKCAHCERAFKHGDLLEVDHITPKSKGGNDISGNLQLLHRHCHDKKTTRDGSLGNKRTGKKSKSPKPGHGQ
jgi:RNA-directed DNA polymerase